MPGIARLRAAPVGRRLLLAAPALLATPVRAQAKPVVLASFSILADLVTQIAGAHVTVRCVVGPNQGPEDFKPQPADIEKARNVDLVVRNGLGLEPWLPHLLRAGRNTAPIVDATERMTPLMYNGVPDPALWLSPQQARGYVLNIADALNAVLSSAAAREVRQATGAFTARLAKLDEDVKSELQIVPSNRQVIVTRQGGLRYFSAAYGVTVMLVPPPGPDGLLSTSEVGVLVRRIRSEGITAVFSAPYGNNLVMDQVSIEAGVRLTGPLFVDTLSPPDGPAPTYEAMMRHNVRLMVSAMLDS